MAAKKGGVSTASFIAKPKCKRPGIHAKCKRSVNKRGKHWQKAYRGQGR